VYLKNFYIKKLNETLKKEIEEIKKKTPTTKTSNIKRMPSLKR